MKKIALLMCLLTACTAAEATQASDDGTGVEAKIALAPLPGATHVLPASAGALMTACRYTSAGYTCPTDDALLLAAGWTVAKPDAVVLFPLQLKPGEVLDVVRAKVDCPSGSTLKLAVKVDTYDQGWEMTYGGASAACTGSLEDLDLDVSSHGLTPGGGVMLTAYLSASAPGAHIRALELSTH